jgi:hypothetical protein
VPVAKFTLNMVWDDGLRLLRLHWVPLVAIAGVFNFLPVLLVNHFFPWPETPDSMDPAHALALTGAYLRQNLIWFVLQSFVVMIGSAAMLRFVFASNVTVGGALRFGLLLLPAYSIMLLFANLASLVGMLLLIVPGLYIAGRLFPAGAAMVAEDRRHPIETIRRAFALTEGHGWRITLLLIVVTLVGMILLLALESLTGSVFILLAGQELGKLLTGIVVALVTAATATLLTMLSAAVYRALAPEAARG